MELSLSITCVAVALKGSLSTPYNFSSSANCPAQTLENCLELEHIPDQRLENQQITIVKKINGTKNFCAQFFLNISFLYHMNSLF